MSKFVKDAPANDVTFTINGAAMAVHNALGPGYKEEVYERALATELERRSVAVRRQHPVEVVHADVPVALFYLDLLVEETVVVEVKALTHQLTNDERAQVINYLKATGFPIGLLLNFGRRRLEYQRIFPSQQTASAPDRLGRDDVQRSKRSG